MDGVEAAGRSPGLTGLAPALGRHGGPHAARAGRGQVAGPGAVLLATLGAGGVGGRRAGDSARRRRRLPLLRILARARRDVQDVRDSWPPQGQHSHAAASGGVHYPALGRGRSVPVVQTLDPSVSRSVVPGS